MTKEELKKEAENWLRKYLLCCNCEKKCNCIDSNSYCEEQVLQAYVDSAEPREKRIAELEKMLAEQYPDLKQSLDWANEREKELEEKISVLLSCKNCPENKGGYICEKEYENKCLAQKIQYIKELQEENAELKKTYSKQRNKRIDELQKENARLTTNEKSLIAERKIIVKENAEAKNLIEELASSLSVVGECGEEECELINNAQKFINKPIF